MKEFKHFIYIIYKERAGYIQQITFWPRVQLKEEQNFAHCSTNKAMKICPSLGCVGVLKKYGAYSIPGT